MIARVLAAAIGLFYLLTGAWAFLLPSSFYTTLATFSPYNLHLLHDAGAFQVGLGAVLVVSALTGKGLVPALTGVMLGSILHLGAHLLDIRLGGHPSTDLPVLTLIVVVLAVALYLEVRRRGAPAAP